MTKELDLVVLTRDIEDHSLKSGDVGTIVHCYDDNIGIEVEFVTGEGKTIAVLTLKIEDIRTFAHSEILHTREVTPLVV